MVYKHPPLTKVSVQLTNINDSLSLSTPMVIILFPVMAGLKNKKKSKKKSKNQKTQQFDSFDYLVVFALFNTLWHLHKTGNGIIAM